MQCAGNTLASLLGLLRSRLEDTVQARGERRILAAWRTWLAMTRDEGNRLPELIGSDAKRGKDVSGSSLLLPSQRNEQVLGSTVRMTKIPSFLFCIVQDILRAGGIAAGHEYCPHLSAGSQCGRNFSTSGGKDRSVPLERGSTTLCDPYPALRSRAAHYRLMIRGDLSTCHLYLNVRDMHIMQKAGHSADGRRVV
jgi:hypothetical protein